MPDVRMPDGTIMRNVPANATKQQIEVAYRKAREAGAVKDSRPESFWRGAVNEMSKGGANAQMAMEYTNPLLAIAGLALNRGKLGSTASREQTQREARNSKYQGSTAGKIAGGIAGSLPAAFVPGGPVLQGALGGAMLTDNPYDPKQLIANAGMGAIGGQWGHVAGKQVVAPVLERVARTAPAQALGRNVVAPAINAAVNSRIGQKITRGAPKVNMGTAPRYSVADKAVRKVNPRIEAARANLEQAKALGLPYALADASPELRMLAGSVARKSPNARALAEQTFEPRGQGQAERAINAIDQYLAPVTNIEKRAGAIRQGAWDAADPLYQKAFAQSAPEDDVLRELLNRPTGRKALASAQQIAMDEGKNPSAIEYFLNDAGSSPIVDDAGRYGTGAIGDPSEQLSRYTLRGWNGSPVSKRGPIDLSGWVRLSGGLRDQNGELSHMGLTNAPRRGMHLVGQEARFGPVINNADGMKLDDAALSAWEAGYFPNHTERPSVNEFLDALRGTHEGWNRHFKADDLAEIANFEDSLAQTQTARGIRFETGKVPVSDKSVDAGPDRPFAPLSAYNMQKVERPTVETLDLIKRGLDQQLNQYRNPITRDLVLEGNPEAQAVNTLLNQFKGRVDNLVPEYAAARKAYQTGIEPRTALNLGYKELPRGNVPERQFTEALSRLAPENLPEAQRGYATAMADAVDRQRLAVNPYNTVYGSPLQQSKVSALFPDGASKFAQTANLERDMQKTLVETIGGSPTQARRMADETFDTGLSPSSIMEFATAPKLSIAKRVGRWAGDTITTGGQGKADEIAPALFNTDTTAVLQYLDDLMRKDAEMTARRRAYGKAGGLFGFPAAAGLVSAGQ